MECDRCKSNRVVSINSKCSDCCVAAYKEFESVGYAPYEIGIGGGDYVEFSFCLDCGKIQGEFPIDDRSLIEFFEESDKYTNSFKERDLLYREWGELYDSER
jgi:hypothetical protein